MNTRLHLLIVFFALALTSSIQAQTNQYLHFDRIDDYVAVPNASQYIANSTGITMAGWFYTDELVYGQGMMGIRDGAGATGECTSYSLTTANWNAGLPPTAPFTNMPRPPLR